MPLFKMRHATIQIHLLRHATIQIHQMRHAHYSKLFQMRHSFKKLLGLATRCLKEVGVEQSTAIEEHPCEEPLESREWGKLGAAGAARRAARGSRLHWQAGARARARPVSTSRPSARPQSPTARRLGSRRNLLPGELAARHPAEAGWGPRELLSRADQLTGRQLMCPAHQLTQQGRQVRDLWNWWSLSTNSICTLTISCSAAC